MTGPMLFGKEEYEPEGVDLIYLSLVAAGNILADDEAPGFRRGGDVVCGLCHREIARAKIG